MSSPFLDHLKITLYTLKMLGLLKITKHDFSKLTDTHSSAQDIYEIINAVTEAHHIKYYIYEDIGPAAVQKEREKRKRPVSHIVRYGPQGEPTWMGNLVLSSSP